MKFLQCIVFLCIWTAGEAVGRSCATNTDCVPDASCTGSTGSQTCQCPISLVPSFYDTKCKFKVGAECKDSSDCMIHSECRTGTCACMDKYAPSSDNKTCIGYIGAECDDISQCIEHAECSGGKCKCTNDYEGDKNCQKKDSLPLPLWAIILISVGGGLLVGIFATSCICQEPSCNIEHNTNVKFSQNIPQSSSHTARVCAHQLVLKQLLKFSIDLHAIHSRTTTGRSLTSSKREPLNSFWMVGKSQKSHCARSGVIKPNPPTRCCSCWTVRTRELKQAETVIMPSCVVIVSLTDVVPSPTFNSTSRTVGTFNLWIIYCVTHRAYVFWIIDNVSCLLQPIKTQNLTEFRCFGFSIHDFTKCLYVFSLQTGNDVVDV
ncbi:hypothetical protein MAR_014275 [Mya arenaria]|uniref:EGF-like domain-containing protein n=1 Tax=Mya arenaria TaxID=6604 RepID=A0ABY7GBI5_MYAAR|nr:hypothetical protein MAR_014275 [Mya arenaria]